MVGIIVQWALTFLLFALRMRTSWECAATSPGITPQYDDTTTTTIAAATTTTSPGCGVCENLPVNKSDSSSRDVRQSHGTGEDGCPTLTIFCQGETPDAATILTWYDDSGTDVGSTFGSGTVTAVLQCSKQNQLLLMNGVVNQVECISG